MIGFNKSYRSPSFEATPLTIQFVILHYTAQNLKKTLDIFLNKKNQVSSHLVIDQDGSLYELVSCLNLPCYKAFHSGKSFWKDNDGKSWEDFNQFSVGIELVNLNGNIFPYTHEQYKTLIKTIKHLQSLYPQLKQSERILGHEHIAGYRGKKDPGYLMDWNKIYQEIYQTPAPPRLKPVFNQVQHRLGALIIPKNLNQSQAKQISLVLEKQISFFFQFFLIIWINLRGFVQKIKREK